jgi:hypothetical protein
MPAAMRDRSETTSVCSGYCVPSPFVWIVM